jgi:hypothetical protein
MLRTTTYQYGSYEHARDLVALSVLPTHVSKGILAQQRNNMLIFLEKNEEKALEGVKNYWGFDTPTWSRLLENNREEHEFNLAEMRKKNNHGATYQDPSLPAPWIAGVQHECCRYGFNQNNFNLKTTNDANTLASFSERKRLSSGAYDPADINFNLRYAFRPVTSIHQSATHEFTHAIKGHHLLRQNIILGAGEKMISETLAYSEQNMPSVFTLMNPLYSTKEYEEKIKQFAENQIQRIKLYPESPENLALVAAQEKTADTYVICFDQKAAENVPAAVEYSGYTANHEDMKIIRANWRTTQAIEDSKQLRRIIGSACGQQECTIL